MAFWNGPTAFERPESSRHNGLRKILPICRKPHLIWKKIPCWRCEISCPSAMGDGTPQCHFCTARWTYHDQRSDLWNYYRIGFHSTDEQCSPKQLEHYLL